MTPGFSWLGAGIQEKIQWCRHGKCGSKRSVCVWSGWLFSEHTRGSERSMVNAINDIRSGNVRDMATEKASSRCTCRDLFRCWVCQSGEPASIIRGNEYDGLMQLVVTKNQSSFCLVQCCLNLQICYSERVVNCS